MTSASLFPESFFIGSRPVGAGYPCFIIAEAGVNHNGSLERALQLVDAAADAGADAVKFQTFRAEKLVTASAPKAEYQTRQTGSGSQFEMLRALELSHEAHERLLARAQERGVILLSTPFDKESADFLAALGLPAMKVSSGDLTNHPFLQHLTSLGKPILLSTGMADLDEVREAVCEIAGAPLALLQCVSNYPAEPCHANLRAMDTMRETFRVPTGYSDHTLGNETALAAVARGACLLEKHLTLDKTLPGPDHAASADPTQFAALVRDVRSVESALGDGIKAPVDAERNTALVARKSVVAARDLPAGTLLSPVDTAILRPGTGLAPKFSKSVLGRKLKMAVDAGTPLSWDLLE